MEAWFARVTEVEGYVVARKKPAPLGKIMCRASGVSPCKWQPSRDHAMTISAVPVSYISGRQSGVRSGVTKHLLP